MYDLYRVLWYNEWKRNYINDFVDIFLFPTKSNVDELDVHHFWRGPCAVGREYDLKRTSAGVWYTYVACPLSVDGQYFGSPEVSQKEWKKRRLRVFCWWYRPSSRISRVLRNRCRQSVYAMLCHPANKQGLCKHAVN